MIDYLRQRAVIDWNRAPDDRERRALDILPANGLTSDGLEWLAYLAAGEALDVVGYIIMRGWVLFVYSGNGCRVAISQRGIDALLI